jgi:hypothetical protein
MTSASNMWWRVPLLLTLLRLLYAEARLSHATAKAGVLVFRAGLGLRVVYLIGIVGFSVGTLLNAGTEEVWVSALGAAFAISMCFAWPVTIAMDDNGIRRTIWWRRSMAIPWAQVSGIERGAAGDMQVFGNHGQSMTFSRFHIDPIRFQGEVMRRAGLRDVTNASDPPTLMT